VVRFDLPMTMIDNINKAYDKRKKDMPNFNSELAGKIAEEKLVVDLLTDEMKDVFLGCFKKYLEIIDRPNWYCYPASPWINEMKASEYNPIHFHSSNKTDLGLSSVLMLKRPSTYGKEVTRPDAPCNGYLEFVGGNQEPLSVSQFRVDAQVGEFYVFPYTLLHGVYPFSDTDEVRRTLSYNCNLYKFDFLANEK